MKRLLILVSLLAFSRVVMAQDYTCRQFDFTSRISPWGIEFTSTGTRADVNQAEDHPDPMCEIVTKSGEHFQVAASETEWLEKFANFDDNATAYPLVRQSTSVTYAASQDTFFDSVVTWTLEYTTPDQVEKPIQFAGIPREVFWKWFIDSEGNEAFLPLIMDRLREPFLLTADMTLSSVDLGCPIISIVENPMFTSALESTGIARLDPADGSVICSLTENSSQEEVEFTRLAAYDLFDTDFQITADLATRLSVTLSPMPCRSGTLCYSLGSEPNVGDSLTVTHNGEPAEWYPIAQYYGDGYMVGYTEVPVFMSQEGYKYSVLHFIGETILSEPAG